MPKRFQSVQPIPLVLSIQVSFRIRNRVLRFQLLTPGGPRIIPRLPQSYRGAPPGVSRSTAPRNRSQRTDIRSQDPLFLEASADNVCQVCRSRLYLWVTSPSSHGEDETGLWCWKAPVPPPQAETRADGQASMIDDRGALIDVPNEPRIEPRNFASTISKRDLALPCDTRGSASPLGYPDRVKASGSIRHSYPPGIFLRSHFPTRQRFQLELLSSFSADRGDPCCICASTLACRVMRVLDVLGDAACVRDFVNT
ncbi:hypothetical protein KM043_014770 [Ampulex compressa]|nr:hypothetical protein KM043_014770 [Ampulex compressa]